MPTPVILAGKGDLAIRIAAYFREHPDYHLSTVLPVVPEPSWTGSLGAWARACGVTVVGSGRHGDVELPPDGRAGLLFSCFYESILPGAFLERFDRALNLHNGPLPRYRGVAPINWALKNEEHEHGVTIHEMTPGIDDGPVVGQVRYSIYPEFDEVATVYERALAYGWTLFAQTMPILDRIRPRPQDHAAATYYSMADNALLDDRSDFTRERSRAGGAAAGQV